MAVKYIGMHDVQFWLVDSHTDSTKQYIVQYDTKLRGGWYCNCPAEIPNCRHVKDILDENTYCIECQMYHYSSHFQPSSEC